MTLTFKAAKKYDAKLRLALSAPTGSGKTWTALLIAERLAAVTGSKIALIDTEHGSASKYADRFAFDVLELDSFGPLEYVAAIAAAQSAGYGILVIDSLSHAWFGKGGALEQVDRAGGKGGNSYTAWRDVTPQQNRLVDAMIGCDMHLIVTMRAKQDYVIEEDSRGKKVPRKVGMAPIQRDGIEYEFDVVAEMDTNLCLTIVKTRCPALYNVVLQPPTGTEIADTLLAWLKGEAAPPLPKALTPPAQTPPAASPPAQQRQPAQNAQAAKPGAKARVSDTMPPELFEAFKTMAQARADLGWTQDQLLPHIEDTYHVQHPRELTLEQVREITAYLKQEKLAEEALAAEPVK